MTWNVTVEIMLKLISPPFQCTSITNHYFRLFDRFTSLLQLYELKSQKTGISVISVQCTSITNHYFSLSDRFAVYYNCMSWTLRKLISLRFQCTRFTNRFLACLTALPLITTVWVEISENSYLRDFSAQVSQIVFLAYLTVLRLITTVWPEMS